jgi:DNA invertase Pin-like site-specific DNA recombinase
LLVTPTYFQPFWHRGSAQGNPRYIETPACRAFGIGARVADAKARKFDAIAVWKLDRWGRTVQQLVNDILDFDSAGIRFIAITQGIDSDSSNPISRLLLHIMSAFAEFERAVINERVVAGIRNAQSKGTRSGRPIGRPKRIFNRGRCWKCARQD